MRSGLPLSVPGPVTLGSLAQAYFTLTVLSVLYYWVCYGGAELQHNGRFPHTPLDRSESSAGDVDGPVRAHVVRRRTCRQRLLYRRCHCGVISIIGQGHGHLTSDGSTPL